MLGIGVLVRVGGATVMVGIEVLVAIGVMVLVGVIEGVQDAVNVKDGSGVDVRVRVAVGGDVLVGGGGGVGVQVVVGVAEGVQEMIGRGTGFLTSWQPLAKSMITPKSLDTTPFSGPPPAQSPSKSIAQVLVLPLLKGSEPPIQLVGELISVTKSPFPPRWKYPPFQVNQSTCRFGYPLAAP